MTVMDVLIFFLLTGRMINALEKIKVIREMNKRERKKTGVPGVPEDDVLFWNDEIRRVIAKMHKCRNIKEK